MAVQWRPPAEGLVIDSGSLASAALEARILDNLIRMQGGPGILQRGAGATIAGNEVIGAETGIRTLGSTGKRGNLIEGNAVGAATGAGILLENNLNQVVGNAIGDAGTGIEIVGSGPFGVKENVVGGDAAADENTIDGSAGDAIRIANPEKALNAVKRNRGDSNGGLFIDLVAAAPETESGWPNHSIAPPVLGAVEQLGVGGSAEPGATVLVFHKQTAATGEVDSFLGEAVADGEGEWSVFYSEPLPAGTVVGATQTSVAGGTSELAIATTADEEELEAGGGGGAASAASAAASGASGPVTAPPADAIRPQTKIARAPRLRSRRRVARFVFYSNEPGATFQCRLDRRRWTRCRSPKAYRHLRRGRHVFRVRAVDRAGNVDRSAATRRFVVMQGKFNRHSRRHAKR